MMLLGSIAKRRLLEILNAQIGDNARKQEAERRIKVAIETIDQHFKDNMAVRFLQVLEADSRKCSFQLEPNHKMDRFGNYNDRDDYGDYGNVVEHTGLQHELHVDDQEGPASYVDGHKVQQGFTGGKRKRGSALEGIRVASEPVDDQQVWQGQPIDDHQVQQGE